MAPRSTSRILTRISRLHLLKTHLPLIHLVIMLIQTRVGLVTQRLTPQKTPLLFLHPGQEVNLTYLARTTPPLEPY
jgi:hypothetical protein